MKLNKKIFFFILTVLSINIGNASQHEGDKKIKTEITKSEITKSVTCSFTISTDNGTYTISATAGNFLTGESRAKKRCADKLRDASLSIAGMNPDWIGINYE